MEPKAAAALYGPSPSLAERSIPDDKYSHETDESEEEANAASEATAEVSDEELPFKPMVAVGVEVSPEMPLLPIQIKVEDVPHDIW